MGSRKRRRVESARTGALFAVPALLLLTTAGCSEVDADRAAYNESMYGSAEVTDADFDDVIAEFTAVIEADPTDAEAYFVRGNGYEDKDLYELALADYNEALRLDPEFVDALVNRGYTYDEMAEYRLAIADYDAALARDPEDGGAYFNRGVSYQNLGNQAKADADFARAKALGVE